MLTFAELVYNNTEMLKHAKNLVETSENLYPGIDVWFDKTFKPDLKSGRRFGNLVYSNETPIGIMLVKQEFERAKICNLTVLQNFQAIGVGTELMKQLTQRLKPDTRSVYFTVAENVWKGVEEFFSLFKFTEQAIMPQQYRNDDIDELWYEAPFDKSKWLYILDRKIAG